jgi:hypothetical protein
MPKVKCNDCGFEFSSNAKSENIEAGKIGCKCKDPECESHDLAIVAEIGKPENPGTEASPKIVDKTPPEAKGMAQLQADGEKAHRAKVDKFNAEQATQDAIERAELAGTPLTEAEQAFVAKIALLMNKGRAQEAPSQAEVLRYSKLVGRKDIDSPEEGD